MAADEKTSLPADGAYNVKRHSLYEQAIELITKYILANNYAVGDPLPTESEFAAMLNVGRNTVREALKTLQAMGIIDTKKTGMVLRGLHLRGLRTFLPYAAIESNNNLESMIRARYWFEDAIAPMIIQNASDDYIAALKMNIEENRGVETTDMEAMIDYDRRFHILLTKCVSNSIISEVGRMINEFFFLVPRKQERFDERSKAQTIFEHQDVVKSIEERDLPGLKEKTRLYILKWLKTADAAVNE